MLVLLRLAENIMFAKKEDSDINLISGADRKHIAHAARKLAFRL